MDINKNYIEHVEDHLNTALANAVLLQKHIQETEGDSDLYRKVSFYLIPTLNHWLHGAQAGSMKDLRDALNKREEK